MRQEEAIRSWEQQTWEDEGFEEEDWKLGQEEEDEILEIIRLGILEGWER